MKENSLKGISRIHSKGAGWLVRLYRNAKVIVKLFSDGVYGDSDKSLQAAQAYYRQAQIKFPPIEKPPFRETPLRNNTPNTQCATCLSFRAEREISCHWRARFLVAKPAPRNDIEKVAHWVLSMKLHIRLILLATMESVRLLAVQGKAKKYHAGMSVGITRRIH
jgi:hypothetical protein